MTDCPNPSRPCGLHDKDPELYIPFAGREVHWGWFVAALCLVIAVSVFV